MGDSLDPRRERARRASAAVLLVAACAAAALLFLPRRSPVAPTGAPGEGDAVTPPPAAQAPPALASHPATAAGQPVPASTSARPALAGRIRGRVLDAGGRPVAHGFVRWNADRVVEEDGQRFLRTSRSSPVPVDGEGRFDIDLPAASSAGPLTLEVRVEGHAQHTESVDAEAARLHGVEVRLAAGPTIRGVARAPDGTAVPGVTLRVVSEGEPSHQQDDVAGLFRVSAADGLPFGRPLVGDDADVTTDGKGRFEIRGLVSCRVTDVSWGWMTASAGYLNSTAVENEVGLVPAACAVFHVVSAADARPVSPRSLFVELGSGAGSSVEPLGPVFAVQWPVARAPRGGLATVEVEAAGYFPTRATASLDAGERRRDVEVRLRPLPDGAVGRLRARLVTPDRRFRQQHFQLELREVRDDAGGAMAEGEGDAPAGGASGLVVERVEAVTEGDDVLFGAVPSGRWRGRIWGQAAQDWLAWSGDLDVAAGRESSLVWTVAPHGAVTFEGPWPANLTITIRCGEFSQTQVLGAPRSAPSDRWLALAPGSWTISWTRPDSARNDPTEEEVVLDVEEGKDHPLRWH